MADRGRHVGGGLVRDLVTPEGVSLPVRLAGAGARAAAFGIDIVILLTLLIAATLCAAFVASGGASGDIVLILWMLGAFALRNFYFIAFEAGSRAATPGKRVMRLRVASRDGGALTGRAVVARNLMREIEIFLPLSFLASASAEGTITRLVGVTGLAWATIFVFFLLLNRDRLRAGDLIAGTWVLEQRPAAIGADLVDGAAAATEIAPFTPAELAAYGEVELHRLEDVLRRGDADAVATVAAAIRRRIGRPDDMRDRAFLDAYYAALRHTLERRMLFGRRKRDKADAG